MPGENEQGQEQQVDESQLYEGLFTDDTPAPQPGPAPEPEKVEPKLSETYEANARLERQNREMKTQLARMQQLEDAAKESPIKALEALGIDPVQFLESLDPDKVAPEQDVSSEVKSELQKLREEQAAVRAQLESEKRNAWVNARKSELSSVFQSSDEHQFAAMAARTDPSFLDGVLEYSARVYQEEGRVPSDAELAKAADQFVMNNFLSNLNSVLTVPAGRNKIEEILKGLSTSAKVEPAQAKTMTNDWSESHEREAKPLSDEEAEKEFIRLMSKDGWVD